MKLLWQARNTPWAETSLELGDTGSAVESSFSHAAFAPSKDALLLAAHQVRGACRLYRVGIEWNMPPKDDPQSAQATPSPVLDVGGLVEEDAFCPYVLPSIGQNETPGAPMGTAETSSSFNLARLLFIPPAPEQASKEPTPHTVFAIFTVVPPAGIGMMVDTSLQWGQASSVLARWEVKTGSEDKLSACFDQLSVKKKGVNGIAGQVCAPFPYPHAQCAAEI